MKNIDYTKTLEALNSLKVETGSLACLGCGYEHHCSTNGCAILRDTERHLVLAQATQNFLQCSNCEYWSKNDPRCMCDKSPYAGHTVRPDNYCSCVSVDMLAASEEARSDLARQLAATQKELAEVKTEREAAISDLHGHCNVCAYLDTHPDCECECPSCNLDCKCRDCLDCSKFEWRGPQKNEKRSTSN